MNKLKRFLLKYLAPEIESIVNDRIKENVTLRKEEKLRCNYPIGKKIIFRSNEPGPFQVGTVSGYVRITQAQELTLTYTDATGKEKILLAENPMYWCQEREDALNKLTWDEQWNVTTKYWHLHKEEAERKNSPEYLNRIVK